MNETPVSPGRRKLYAALKLTALALVVALCVLVLRPVLTDPATFTGTLEYLDEKKQNAMMISLGSTSASFIVTMIPDDTGTPIANELAQLSGYLLFVLSAILLERYLLTALGFLATCIVMPLACGFGALAVLAHGKNKQKFREYAVRFVILAVCVVQIIPVGCVCGREIERANAASIDAALTDARNANEIVKSIPEDQQNKNIFEKVGDFFSGLWSSATEAYEWAKSVLGNFLSSVAVMLVTTVAIPVLILLCYVWLIRLLTRRDFTASLISLFSGPAGRGPRHPDPDGPEGGAGTPALPGN